MGTPKKHKTHAGKGQRRSHDALKGTFILLCPKCKAPMLPHHVCMKCGNYNNRTAVVIKQDKKTKKEKKGKAAGKK